MGYPCLYECEWVKGTTTKGRMVVIVDNNQWDNYEGQFNARLFRTGTGRWEHEDGDTYYGEWKHDKTNGQGKYTWPDGEIYEGQWQDGNKHGQGKYTYPNGETHEGQWQDNKPNGEGKRTFTDGTYEVGKWKDDNQIGVQQYFSKQGKHIENRTYEDHVLIKTEKII
ncbi:hypothetical protein FGO68_gene8549 [Halteria grandinella]|uniref:MORN repeat protein n=1 Tax=Halteria grandinella TaxID=5974 RepID=A0A8J8SV62_HALGN|nr:hypothetical protein FGO68_gene8549 [Halteria grandinella]